MKKLFTNVVMAKASKEQVLTILENPEALLQWVPEVQTVTQAANAFTIHRSGAALNQTEHIAVGKTANQVVYRSTEGRVAYDLIFDLAGEAGGTTITETVYLDETAVPHLPLTLLAPIAKHAFGENLDHLAELAERLSYTNS
jgi:predicted ATPase